MNLNTLRPPYTKDAPFKAACIQMCSGCDPDQNIKVITQHIATATTAGAEFIALPETCNFMERGRAKMHARLMPENQHPTITALSNLANNHQIWLLAGSIIIANNDAKAVNRSYLFDPTGRIIAQYDKIHLFDVTLENGETHRESESYTPGENAVIAKLPWGNLGLSICYDLRFPTLYQELANANADFITVPSAFTVQTGKAHWHILLRARAIETAAYIIAPAQVGTHENGRKTYGHSLIINPWGKIIAEANHDENFIIAEIDPKQCVTARKQIPTREHVRIFNPPK